MESFPDLQAVAEASFARVALELVDKATADVVIVDLALPTAAEGLKLVRDLSRYGRDVYPERIGPRGIGSRGHLFVEKDEHGATGLVEGGPCRGKPYDRPPEPVTPPTVPPGPGSRRTERRQDFCRV